MSNPCCYPQGPPTVNINGGFLAHGGSGGGNLSNYCEVNRHGDPVEPRWFCDPATREITGGIIYNLTCDGLDLIYLDADSVLTSVAPTGIPCTEDDYEYKNVTFCLTDGEGNYYQKEMCRTYLNDILTTTEIIFHYPDGSQSPDPPVGVTLIPCEALQEETSIIDLPLCDPGL